MTAVISPQERAQLTEMTAALFKDIASETEVRRLMATDSGFDPAAWRLLAEVGLTGLLIPEDLGGGGATMLEVGAVTAAAGRVLLCAPLLSCLLGTAALTSETALAHEAAAAILPEVAAGRLRLALATAEPGAGWTPDAVTTTARADASGWRIDGTKTHVIDGHSCDVLIVSARTEAGIALFLADGKADGVARRGVPTLDQTRKLAEVRFDRAAARLIVDESRSREELERILGIGGAALAAEQAGGAERTLEMAVQYAGLRTQFGRPIGSFQAIKHHCADMLIQVELARSAADHALEAAAELSAPGNLTAAAAMAQAFCGDAFYRCAAANLQVHGGIGFTWEHPAHLYLKRAKSSQQLMGDSRFHRRRLAHALGLTAQATA